MKAIPNWLIIFIEFEVIRHQPVYESKSTIIVYIILTQCVVHKQVGLKLTIN